MATTTVTNYLLEPGTNRGKHPATQGSSWSCNMFREVSGANNYLTSLPGIRFAQRFNAGSRCRGAYVSSVGLLENNQEENAFVVFGNVLYRIDWTGAVSRLGNVAPGRSRVSFAETGGLRPMLLVADGKNLWAYDLLEGGNLQRVTLPERITGEGGDIAPSAVAVIDGVIAVTDSGSGFIYYSYLAYPLNNERREVFDIVDGQVQYEEDNPLVVKKVEVDSIDWVFKDNYGNVTYKNAETSSDSIVNIKAVGSTLYVLGKKTIEIWQRGTTNEEPWICTSYTTNASNGVAAPDSVTVCGSSVFYIGKGDSYAKAVMCITGTQYTKVSEPWLDRVLLNETSESAYGFSYAVGSHVFYVIHLPESRQCWTYDTATKEWHERRSRQRGTGTETPWRVTDMIWFKGKFWAFCDDGCAYTHDEDYYFEDFADTGDRLPMIRHRQGAVIVNQNAPFVFLELAVECNTGTYADYHERPYLQLEISKDGGNTWGNVRQASLGLAGQYSHRVRFLSLGLNRLCVLRLTYSHGTALELTSCSQRVSPTWQAV